MQWVVYAGDVSHVSFLDLFGPIAGATNPNYVITFQANLELRMMSLCCTVEFSMSILFLECCGFYDSVNISGECNLKRQKSE